MTRKKQIQNNITRPHIHSETAQPWTRETAGNNVGSSNSMKLIPKLCLYERTFRRRQSQHYFLPYPLKVK